MSVHTRTHGSEPCEGARSTLHVRYLSGHDSHSEKSKNFYGAHGEAYTVHGKYTTPSPRATAKTGPRPDTYVNG